MIAKEEFIMREQEINSVSQQIDIWFKELDRMTRNDYVFLFYDLLGLYDKLRNKIREATELEGKLLFLLYEDAMNDKYVSF